MDIIELKNQIMNSKLKNFYVFTGSEIGIQNIYLKQMAVTLNIPVVYADTVASIYSRCTTKSLVSGSSCFYIIRGDNDFMKNEDLYMNIEKKVKSNVIVVLYEKIDSRLKFGKHFKDCTVEFGKLATNILIKYLEAENLSNKVAEELSNKVSGSYDMAMLEADKINQFAQAKNIKTDESFNQLIKMGVISQPQGADVFEFTDLVCRRQRKSAVKLARILQDNGVSAINILGTLYNSMRTLLLIQCCEGSNVSEITGLDNKLVYMNKKYVDRYYNSAELVSAVKQIEEVVSGIKSGWIDEKYSVRYTLCNIM